MTALSRFLIAAILGLAAGAAAAASATYPLPVLPREDKHVKDPVTGVDLLFVTTDPAPDHNLYFHERSWLADESMLIFTSERKEGGTMGYLFATGELVRFLTPQGGVSAATAAVKKNAIYAARGRDILEIRVKVVPSRDPACRSQVIATERVICTLAADEGLVCALNENCDGRLLGVGVNDPAGMRVDVVDIKTGKRRTVARGQYGGHLQWSRTNPNWLSVAGMKDRLVMVDITRPGFRVVHHQVPGEYVTHESWWVNDQMIFCGGYRDKESHVKVVDPRTGQVRIVGAGAWVPWTSTSPDVEGDDVLNRWNWWHCSGDQAGKWIAADNWYGDIVIFDGKTGQPHRLTLRHSHYGGGKHPEVGWDRSSRRVVFRSQMLGGIDVCVATLPERWPDQDPFDQDDLFITGGVPYPRVPNTPQER